MDFNPAIPVVNARQLAQVVAFVKSTNPQEASFADIEAVFAWIGRCLCMSCLAPFEALEWAQQVPNIRLLATEVICQGVLANAMYIMAKRVDSALFALVALRDLRTLKSFRLEPFPPTKQTPEGKDDTHGNR